MFNVDFFIFKRNERIVEVIWATSQLRGYFFFVPILRGKKKNYSESQSQLVECEEEDEG